MGFREKRAAAEREKAVHPVVLLDVERIAPNPAQPRTVFAQDELESLAHSIQENGLLQPLTVRSRGDGYELISGERRLRALRLAGIPKAPCIVLETTDRQSAVLALVENLQREDLNYFEEAQAIKNLMVEWGISQQELGIRLGKAQSTIANKLRLLRYEAPLQQEMLAAGINERQARALLQIEDPVRRKAAVSEVAARHLNAAQTEDYVTALVQGEPGRKARRVCPVVKDVRVFLNTVNRAISVMKQSGIPASTQKIEREDCIEYIVTIPLSRPSA